MTGNHSRTSKPDIALEDRLRMSSREWLQTALKEGSPGLITLDQQSDQKFADEAADVNRVEQQTAFYCGAACTVMILKRYQVTIDQPTAYLAIHDDGRFATEKLYSDPTGVQEFMNSKLPDAIQSSIQAADTFQAALANISTSIGFASFPCAVLAQGGNHWVVVDRIRVIEDVHQSQAIIGVVVENPWYNKTPHTYIDLQEFQDRWLTANQWGVTWRGKFVAVAGPATRATRSFRRIDVVSANTRFLKALAKAPSSSDLIKMALLQLKSHGFDNVRELSGGGAAVTKPITVVDGAKKAIFHIVPVDATSETLFQDFCYCAIEVDTGRLLEFARMEIALDVLNDDETSSLLKTQFAGQEVEVDPNYYWIEGFLTMGRFDVMRRATVAGTERWILKGGSIKADPAGSPNYGG